MNNNILSVLIIGLGALLATGVINSAPSGEPCTANEKLLDIIKDQQKKISDILVADIAEANKAKKDAETAKKNYEEKLEELKNKPCVK